MTVENEIKIKEILRLSNNDTQQTVCMEEAAELIQAISKIRRYGLTPEYKTNIAGEIADVCICIEQLLIMYGIDSYSISDIIEKKIDRTIERLQNSECGKYNFYGFLFREGFSVRAQNRIKEMGITSIEELVNCCCNGSLKANKYCGKKTKEEILNRLKELSLVDEALSF